LNLIWIFSQENLGERIVRNQKQPVGQVAPQICQGTRFARTLTYITQVVSVAKREI